MLKYIIRRVLYMIPTLFGIMVITFVLFNVAGGDPAKLKLGKQASPRMLEDYDLQRGYNKPLLFGHWGTVRAFYDSDFQEAPGPWSQMEGAEYVKGREAFVRLSSGHTYPASLAFSLQAGDVYRWDIRFRLTPDPAAGGDGADGPAPEGTFRAAASFAIKRGAETVAEVELTPSDSWQGVRLEFLPEQGPPDLELAFAVSAGRLDVSSIRLRRRVTHVLDSQFLFYMRQLARFDFGISHETNQRVSTMIKSGVVPSLTLTVPMFIVGLFTSISLALVCAFFRNSFIDRFFVILSVILMSVNYLVWIVLGQYVLGYAMRWFPVWGFESWRYILLPCLIGVVSGLGGSLRFYRTVMLDEMYRDYVRTAFAKGVTRRGVLFRHVLKNAMIPILTSVVMTIPFLFVGSLLLESFFGIPGLGSLAFNAINNSDVDVIRAVVVVGAVLYVVANLVTDICYAAVDPRVRLR